MLMTVLKGDLAVRQSKAFDRAFKLMKDYISQDPLLLNAVDTARLSLQISEHAKEIREIMTEWSPGMIWRKSCRAFPTG